MILEILLFCIAVIFLIKLLRKPSNYPPGPWGLPLFGHLPIFGSKSFDERILDLKNKHGNVFMWRMGSRLIVYLMDFKQIKEHLGSQDFIDRPKLRTLSLLEDYGLVATNGIEWHQNRRFSIRILRDLGMGKSRLVSSVQYEAEELIKVFKQETGKPTLVPQQLKIAPVNVIWQMLASRRYEANDPDFIKYSDLVEKTMQSVNYIMLLDIFPWIETILPKFITEVLFKEKEMNLVKHWYKEFAMKLIKESENSLDEDNPKDYIDHYLLEMKKSKTEENSHMSYEDLVGIVIDLHSAGGETTAGTITWAIFYLIKFPEVQKKVQKDTDEILTGDQLATLEDKSRLNYTEAFIHETLRFNSFAPNGVVRRAVRDLTINGFFIPKGTFLNSGLYWCHHDPQYWKNPNSFEPERFLDDNGKFVAPKEGFMPFGSGKRVCVGESLSRMELFIFISSLVKNFEFSAPPGKEIDISPCPSNNFIHVPRIEQNIIITCRK